MTYSPAELDILSRAFHGAIETLSMRDRDAEATKAVIMTGILDAARMGERDAEKLKELALEAVKLYEVGECDLDAAMSTVPL
jgi:hypothetical protein